jgi:hypothetical protein
MKSEGKIQFERRNAARFPAAFKMSYEVMGAAGKGRGKAADLSRSGIQIYSKNEARVGDKLKVFINTGPGKGIEATAVVVWVCGTSELGIDVGYKYALGLKFSEIKKDGVGFLEDFVERGLKRK